MKNPHNHFTKTTKRNILALGASMRRAPIFADRRHEADWEDEDWGDDPRGVVVPEEEPVWATSRSTTSRGADSASADCHKFHPGRST